MHGVDNKILTVECTLKILNGANHVSQEPNNLSPFKVHVSTIVCLETLFVPYLIPDPQVMANKTQEYFIF